MVLKSTSFNDTPPLVTNSSLKVLLPDTLNFACANSLARLINNVFEMSFHFRFEFIPDAVINLSQSLKGILNKG